MKKLYAGLALAAALFAGTATTYAGETMSGSIVTGTTYTISYGSSGSYTAPQTGYLTATYSSYQNSTLYEGDSDEDTPWPVYDSSDEGTIYYKYAMNAGQTAYFLPGFVFDSYDVTFTWQDDSSAQGPNLDITYTVQSMTPSTGELAGLEDGQQISVTFAENVPSNPLMSIWNETAQEYNTSIVSAPMEGSGTTWTYTVPDYDETNKVYFYKGMTYTPHFYINNKMYESGITWTGTYEANAADAPEFLGVTPANGTEIQMEDTDVIITFSGAVTVTATYNLGSGASQSVTCTPNDDQTVWTVTIPKSATTTSGIMEIQLAITATYGPDNTKIQFKDENDMTYYDYLALTYPIFGKKAYSLRAVTVRELVESGPMEEINGTESDPTQLTAPVTGFNIYNTNPVQANYAEIDGAFANIGVYNQAGGLVTKIDTEYVSDAQSGGLDISFKEPISADGIYKLIIPELALDVTADQGTVTYYNEETVVWFQIGTETMVVPECPEATPNKANNSEVTSLSNLTVSWGAPLSNINTSLISVNKVVGTASEPVDFSAYISPAIEEDDDDVLVIQVDNVIGNVEVNIGASAVNILVDGVLIGNDPVTLSYIVVEPEYTALPANVAELMGDEGEVIGWKLTWEGISQCYFNDDVAGPLTATNNDTNESFTITQGNEIVAIGGELTIDLSNLPGGNYTVLLPEAYLLLGENYVNASEELKVKTTAVSSLVADKYLDGAVYNLQGMKVNANNLKPGIYVIDGKKVLVK